MAKYSTTVEGSVGVGEQSSRASGTGLAATHDVGDERRPEHEALLDEGLFRAAFESSLVGIVRVTAEGEYIEVNDAFANMLGYSRDELVGMTFRDVTHPNDISADEAGRAAILSGGGPHQYRGEKRYLGKDGSVVWADQSAVLLEANGYPAQFHIHVVNITERKRTQRDAAHFAAVVESSNDAIVGKDLDGFVTSWNGGATRLYGYSEAEMLGRSISVLAPPGRGDELPEIVERVRLGERIDAYETVCERRDGTQVDVSLTVSPIRDPDGTFVGASMIGRDISARLRYQEQLRVLSEQDSLTGLRNRRRFERDVAEQVGRARRYREPAVLLIVDIDRFKEINDAHGHREGDVVLKQFAAMLDRRLRSTDVIARIGGDEFAALLPYAGEPEAAAIATDLRRVIRESKIDIADGTSIQLSASIGVALITEDTASGEMVLAAADRAMYDDKQVQLHSQPADQHDAVSPHRSADLGR